MPGAELDGLLRRLPTQFSVEPQARMELFTGTMRWVVNVAGATFKMEVFLLGSDAHHAAIFERKRRELIVRLKQFA